MGFKQPKIPKQQRSRATVECLLEAATQILEEGGIESYNTNYIAEKAGVSVGSLYQYFPNKDSITYALIVRSHELIITSLHKVLEQTERMSFDKALSVVLREIITLHTESPRLNRILELEESRLPHTEELRQLECEIEELNRQFFMRYIDATKCGEDGFEHIVVDTITITRSLLDSALQRKAIDHCATKDRILRILLAYTEPYCV